MRITFKHRGFIGNGEFFNNRFQGEGVNQKTSDKVYFIGDTLHSAYESFKKSVNNYYGVSRS